MKALKLVIWVILILASISVIISIVVRGWSKGKVVSGSIPSEANMPDSKVVLGSMPSEEYMSELVRRTVVDMRKWVQNFKPSDAKKLNDTGKIVFSWEELKASYPEQARIVDDYVEQARIGFVAAFTKKPVPDRLAMHHNPDTVEIERLGIGQYGVVISSKEGIEHAFLEISMPQ